MAIVFFVDNLSLPSYLDSPEGIYTTESTLFQADLSRKIVGIEVIPHEDLCQISPRDREGKAYSFSVAEQKWVESEPEYYSLSEFREICEFWVGAISFSLQFDLTGRAIREIQLKVAFDVPFSFENYLYEFALPQYFLETSVELNFQAIVGEDGLTLPAPEIPSDRVTSVEAFLPDRQRLLVGGTIEGEVVRLDSPLPPGEFVYLLIGYEPLVRWVPGKSYQLEEIPCALLFEEGDPKNIRSIPVWSSVATKGGGQLYLEYSSSFDRPIKIVCVAPTQAISRQLAQTFYRKVCDPKTAYIDVGLWNHCISFSHYSPISPDPMLSSEMTNAFSHSFTFTLFGVLGETIEIARG